MKENSAISFLLFASVLLATGGCNNADNQISVARSIIHRVDWISIATLSTLKKVKGYPFVNLKSVSDGPKHNGTGVPYLLMTDLDISGADVKVNNAVTVMATLAELNDCTEKKYDPQDPRCGRLLISGKLIKLDPTSEEYSFAQAALFEKHPVMKIWIRVHQFYFAKINIENILLLDHFGGADNIDVEAYLKAPPPTTWAGNEEKAIKRTKFFFNTIDGLVY